MAMRVGLLMPQYGCALEETLATAAEADRHGLDIWVAGQMLAISDDTGQSAFEPLTLMGAIAARTRRSRLGFMVLAAPYLPALYLAKALMTLDHLSDGRLDIGLGAGWREEEFEALGIPFEKGPARRATLEHVVDLIEAHGKGGSAAEQLDLPGPPSVQRPRPPIWIAGRGERILEVVGRRADWANFARGISVEEFAASGEIVRDAARAAGRADDAVSLSLTGTFLGGDEEEVEAALERRAAARGTSADEYRATLRAANAFVGTPDQIAEQLRPYDDSGCRAVVLWPLDGGHVEGAATLGEVARLTHAPR